MTDEILEFMIMTDAYDSATRALKAARRLPGTRKTQSAINALLRSIKFLEEQGAAMDIPLGDHHAKVDSDFVTVSVKGL